MASNNGQKLKSLRSRMKGVLQELEDAQITKDKATARVSELKRQQKDIEDAITMLKQGRITVSEHAAIQYIARVMGIAFDDLSEKVWPHSSDPKPNGQYPCGTHKAVLRDGVVVTVVENREATDG